MLRDQFGRIPARTELFVQAFDLTATNGFKDYFLPAVRYPGPMQLIAPSGRVIKPRKTELRDDKAFHAVVHLAGKSPPARREVWSTTTGPVQLGGFDLHEQFEIKESGEHKLIVWPKLYRMEADWETLTRIDLPEVSIVLDVHPVD